MNAQLDPKTCVCHSKTDSSGIIIPVLCREHNAELKRKLGGFSWILPKYQRYFDNEADAKESRRIILDRWPTAGYGTIVSIVPISRWWLLRGSWSDSCD